MGDLTHDELRHAEDLARRHFGFASLRPGQAETIARVLRGEDVLAILPTGGGKSLCYQLPAVLAPGVTVVVSPLLALMKDQLDNLPDGPMRLVATALTSEMLPAHQRRVLERLAAGEYRLLYVAPERLRHLTLLRALKRAGVKRLVVDEAHCISSWGHDFRPDYLGIADARKALGSPPVLALTATAPPRVADDIERRLGTRVRVATSVARPNLRLEAIACRDADEKLAQLAALCRAEKGPGIVYCASRSKTEQIAEALRRKGVLADAYHAGLGDRAARQDAFMRGSTDVLVATVAFGMGVDKADIRFVFHHDASGSLESYWQEAGRAGRDGKPARCVVFATSQDASHLKTRAKRDLPPQALVEQVWGAILASASGDGYALLDPGTLDGLDPADDVKPRLALSALHESGAVDRLGDVPRFLLVGGAQRGLFELAAELGVPPEDVEEALVERGAPFSVASRALLLRVRGAPERVEAILEARAKRAQQRADEMMGYVRAASCRHARIRAHFGEAAPPRCDACDNCLGIRHAAIEDEDPARATSAVLAALAAVRGIGEANLVLVLRADGDAPGWAQSNPAFGRLAFRSEAKVRAALRACEAAGWVARETLSHGGASLRLTDAGRAALAHGTPPPPGPPLPPVASHVEEAKTLEVPRSDPLFAALREWRRATADAEGVPPYVVAHDRTLAAIAAARPTTREALLAVKGMGPKRVEKYGEALLDVVRRSAGPKQDEPSAGA